MSLSNLYNETELTSKEYRLETAIKSIRDAIRSKFTREKSFLDTVELEFPHIGVHHHPLDYYSVFKPGNKKQSVVMPILSLVFFEDLCTAYGWLWANSHSLETVDEYITMLKVDREYQAELVQCLGVLKEFQKCRERLRNTWASDFVDRKFPLPPQNALQIPKDALQDENIEGLSRRFRNSGYAFILAHELGHLYHNHTDQNITNEIEADLFALEVMQSTSTIPMGMVLWFLATAYYFPTRGSFESEKKWEEFVKNEMTHPLNEQRLIVLATRLNEYANDDNFTKFAQVPAADKEVIRFIADGVLKIVSVLEDVDIQRYMITKARSSNVSSLAPRPQINLNDPSQFPSSLEPLSPATIPPELATLIAQITKRQANQRPNRMADVKRDLQRLATQSLGSSVQLPPNTRIDQSAIVSQSTCKSPTTQFDIRWSSA